MLRRSRSNTMVIVAGFDVTDAARIFSKLMQRLNFPKYFAQGGDWGSRITTIMAQAYPE